MIIQSITISGADDKVRLEDMVEFSKKYPQVEWGILASTSRLGTPRYPRLEWIADCDKTALTKSLHFCGQIMRDVVMGKTVDLPIDNFQRIQLNIGNKISSIDPNDFAKGIRSLHPKTTIVQISSAIPPHIMQVIRSEKCHVLYDGSGGFGILRPFYDPPCDVFTGYAGGLNPDNISEELCRIEKVAPSTPIWIDVESGIRTNDAFDWSKVERFVQRVLEHTNGHSFSG